MTTKVQPSVTVMFPGGRLRPAVMKEIQKIAEDFSLGIYLTTAQNLRLIDVPEESLESIKQRLLDLGLQLKGPGKFPLPRVCVGMNHCNLGVADTLAMSEKITAAFAGREKTKGKFKIAIAGCNMCCSSPKTTDMGIVATRDGFEFFVGGKGGPYPKIGKRIGRNLTDEQVLEIMAKLVEYHDEKTIKKQRFAKLMDLEDFPYPEV
ncbi:NAD(P)/FAD-dependent oxidoreductase [Desulfogranum japonicum]|uniref:hypothetical protein n=1 Tax=Desulfogranum japonicum TaxID=231447 RepID=UPI0003FB2763|nr:hypothetical protein [Desulfogranum japonicum]